MALETMKLSVDTGSVLIDIDDKGDIIGQFRFNPADLDIARRYEQVVDALNKISLSEEATQEDVFAVSDEIKKQFDYLLNYNVSETIFAKANPLTPLANGDEYCVNVLEGIANLIERTMNKRLERKRTKIRKATSKYHK